MGRTSLETQPQRATELSVMRPQKQQLVWEGSLRVIQKLLLFFFCLLASALFWTQTCFFEFINLSVKLGAYYMAYQLQSSNQIQVLPHPCVMILWPVWCISKLRILKMVIFVVLFVSNWWMIWRETHKTSGFISSVYLQKGDEVLAEMLFLRVATRNCLSLSLSPIF